MKTFASIASRLFNRPLLLHAPVLRNFSSVVGNRLFGGDIIISAEESIAQQHRPRASAVAPFAQRASDRVQNICDQFGNVAVIYVCGVIEKALSDWEVECFDAVDLRDVDQAISLARDNPQITKVLFVFDTPGGSIVGLSDTATRIRELAEVKEVHGFTDTLCCSAGIRLACECDWFVASPSAIVGSIGVYMSWWDATEAYKAEGLKVECVSAGKYKTMCAEWKATSDEERALLQDSVIRSWDEFRAAVTRKRDVPQEAMEGQCYDATEALGFNVVDELVTASIGEYVAAMLAVD